MKLSPGVLLLFVYKLSAFLFKIYCLRETSNFLRAVSATTMALVMTRTVILFLCSMIIAQYRTEGTLLPNISLSKTFLDFTLIGPGNYDTNAYPAQPGQSSVRVQKRVEVILLSKLQFPAVFLEEAKGGIIFLRIFCELFEKGGNITARIYTLDIPEKKFGEFDISTLVTVDKERYQRVQCCDNEDEESKYCDAQFTQIDVLKYEGIWTYCPNGERHQLKMILDCSSFNFTFTVSNAYTNNVESYNLGRTSITPPRCILQI